MMSSPVQPRKNYRKGSSGQNIKVFVRCRPMNSQEKFGRSHSLVECQGGRDIVVRERPQDKFTKTFSFDKVFAADSKQLDVYKCVAKPLVDEVLNGFNCTIFAYGQTGTGKTFTMEGERTADCTTWQDDPLAGIIPRCVNHLFDELRIQKLEFTMRVSFLELYNEELFDLLSAQDDLSKLRMYEDSSRKGSCIIQGLEEVLVRSKSDVYSVIEKGSAKRQTAATLMNAHSSRSHTVFTVTIHIKENTLEGDELLKTGKLHLVDLAGSENIGRSGAVDKRAREAGSINQSLLTLGRVITSLVEKAPHVPYRESKLTRLLQDALGGRTKTSIIATVSPASINLEETLSTLDYAHRAKNITNKPEVNQKLNKKELIGEYTEEIDRLRRDLLAMREKNGVYLANENYQEMVDTMEQQAREIGEKIAHIRLVEEELDKKTEMFDNLSSELALTTDRLQETESNLVGTRKSLRKTQSLLHTTAQDRDEQKYIVAAHEKTEGVLHSQGRSLIGIADTATSHIELLHEKIARKRMVEEHNSEESVSFEGTFTSHVVAMQNAVHMFKGQHQQQLTALAKEHGLQFSSLKDILTSADSEIAGAGAGLRTLLATLQDGLKQELARNSSALLAVASTTESTVAAEVARLDEVRTASLMPLLSDVTGLTEKLNTVMQELVQSVMTKVCEWQSSCKSSHEQHAVHSAALQTLLQERYNSYTQHAEEQQRRMESVADAAEQHGQHMETRLEQLASELNALRTLHKEHRAAVAEERALAKAEHRQTGEALTKASAEDVLAVLGECGRSAHHAEETSARQQQVQELLTREQEQMCGLNNSTLERCSSVCNSVCASVEQTVAGLHDSAARISSHCIEEKQRSLDAQHCIKETVKTGEANICGVLEAQCTAVQSAVSTTMKQSEALQAALSVASSEHCEALGDHCDQLSRRQGELHELFSRRMVKDVPTGGTPSRQEYPFSRSLSATSPHERLLARYRAAHTTHYAARQPLPLGPDNELDSSSFCSLDNSAAECSTADSGAPGSDYGGSPTEIARSRAVSLLDVCSTSADAVFAVPPAPHIVRENSREDPASASAISGIPAPVRPTHSAPVSRSTSSSSLPDCKENQMIIDNSSMYNKKKRVVQQNGDALPRPRKVLGSQN